MPKIRIDSNAFGYPMPMTLIGATVNGEPNFLAAAWVSRVNYNPPLISVALGNSHHTNAGIHGNKTFSVNIPSAGLVRETDYCGIVSGKKEDKSGIFDVFYGELKTAPMAGQCPVCMECRLVNAVDLGVDTLFIGEIVAAYCEERCLKGGVPDAAAIKPFVLTMPDNTYWTLGTAIGKAWSLGKALIRGGNGGKEA